MFVKMSLRDWLVCFAGFVGLNLLAHRFLLPACRTPTAPFRLWLPSPNCFLRVCLPTLFAAVLKFFLPLTTSAISGTANSNKSAPTRFAAWTIYLRKNGIAVPNNLCKCTESPSTLSTNTSIEWNLYFSWSNHLVTSFRLEMNVGSFSEHQIKTSDTDRYKRYFFTARVSQVNVITMKRIFEQRSELQLAKCLIVHVLSSSYNVSRLELSNKKEATQQWSFCVANDILLNQVGVYHDRVYADNVVSKFWFVRSFSSQHYSKFITNITCENVSQIRTKECKTGSSICKVNLNSLRSSRHFNFDTVFAVIVSFLKENVHGFNNIRNGSVKTRCQVIEFWWLWKFLVKKHKFSLRNILVHSWVGYFWNCNLRLTIQIQLLW